MLTIVPNKTEMDFVTLDIMTIRGPNFTVNLREKGRRKNCKSTNAILASDIVQISRLF